MDRRRRPRAGRVAAPRLQQSGEAEIVGVVPDLKQDRLAGIGIALGLAGAVALRQVVASQLYQVSALDPLVLAFVPLTMLGVALVASYVPARRASRVNPSTALREN